MTTATNNRPVTEIRIGRIKATVWENQADGRPYHTFKLTKLYRKDDAWKETTSFGRDDALLIMKVVDQVHSFIFEHGTDNGDGVETQDAS